MACGVGVCMTCVMPVTGADGTTRMVRSCVEGPVFRGDRVRWDAFDDGYGRVPGRRRRGAAGRGGTDERRHERPTSAALALPNPLMTASGCAANGRELHPSSTSRARRVRDQVGDAAPRSGRAPRGWPRPRRGCSTRSDCRARASTPSSTTTSPWLQRGAPACWSRSPAVEHEYAQVAAGSPSPAFDAVVGVEVNISCPNVANRGLVFACDPLASAEVVALSASGCPAASRCWPSCRPTSPTSSRSRGLHQGRRPRPERDQHAARHGHRHRPDAAAARREPPVDCPVRRSVLSRSGPCGRSPRRCARVGCRRCRSSASAACAPASTRCSSSPPAPAPCRSAP